MSVDRLVFIPAVCFLTAVKHYIKFMSIKYYPKCDPHIIETLKKNLGFEERAFYHLNQRIQPNGTEEITSSSISMICDLECWTFGNGCSSLQQETQLSLIF